MTVSSGNIGRYFSHKFANANSENRPFSTRLHFVQWQISRWVVGLYVEMTETHYAPFLAVPVEVYPIGLYTHFFTMPEDMYQYPKGFHGDTPL